MQKKRRCVMKEHKNRNKIYGRAVLSVTVLLLGCLTGSCGKKQNRLNIYMSEYQQSYYKDAIEDFKEAWPDVELEITSYGMNEPLSVTQKAKTQMMAGEGPDLLLFTSLGIDDVDKFMAAGAFAPLDAYMSSDKEWDSSRYVSGVMEGGRFHDTQYVMPLNYDVQLVLSSREALGEAGFDIGACTDMLSLMQQISGLYETDYQQRILADCSMFIFFPQQLKGSFMDYATGEIGTDPKELKAACEAYRNIYEEDNTASSMREKGDISPGTAILDRRAYITAPFNPRGVWYPAVAIAAKETPVIIPVSKGDGTSIAQISEYAGIRANSENKEQAWNMLRILMDEDAQTKMSAMRDKVPVLISVIDAHVERIIADAFSSGKEEGVETGTVSAAFTEEYLEYLKNPGAVMFLNEISRKFIERMIPYLEGEAEYEDCLKEFENYAKIYLTE